VERVTEDNDSGLPRYYYSRWDHYLSPTWSQDGSEIIFVSNRGPHPRYRRFLAHGGAPGRGGRGARAALRGDDLEGAPRLGPDGKRVVYSSYAGRQWNQLWLMTSGGGDPFPLTYGDFDATAPRWSRDGGRIAYVSNEGGNTSYG